VVLNRSNGSEYTMDTDGDGYPEYAPIAYYGSKSGNTFPPIVLGTDDVIYQNAFTSVTSNVRGQVAGWNMGTAYLSFTGLESASDEPQAISAGGNIIYQVSAAIVSATGKMSRRAGTACFGTTATRLAPSPEV
jgi:hypothetical protein